MIHRREASRRGKLNRACLLALISWAFLRTVLAKVATSTQSQTAGNHHHHASEETPRLCAAAGRSRRLGVLVRSAASRSEGQECRASARNTALPSLGTSTIAWQAGSSFDLTIVALGRCIEQQRTRGATYADRHVPQYPRAKSTLSGTWPVLRNWEMFAAITDAAVCTSVGAEI